MTDPACTDDRKDGQADASRRAGRGWRWTGYAAFAAVVALGFWGYSSPGLRLSWDALVALCGF
jgi:hypothetical protein